MVWICTKRAQKSWTPVRARRAERAYSAQARSIFASVLVARAHWAGSHACGADDIGVVVDAVEECLQSALLDTALVMLIKRLTAND